MSGSAKEIYFSNHGRSLNIRIGQNYTTYDSIQDLTYVWRTRACENYLGIKIIKNDTQSNVFWGNFECTF